MRPSATGSAFARAGLLGNPSDGYGGKAIAMSLYDFEARVTIEPSDRLRIGAGDGDATAASLRDLDEAFVTTGPDDGSQLLRAAIHRFTGHRSGLRDLNPGDPRARFTMRFDTSIPRQVGLGGSSAIVIAALRALMRWFDVAIDPATLAELALAAEVHDLGIAAGAMDRVIQAHEGVMVMDLREPRTAASYRRLDPDLVPPVVVAWDPRGGAPSGVAHGTLRARWRRGDPEVLEVVEAFRHLVDAGAACLRRRDTAGFRDLVNRNFELRTRIFPVADTDRRMVSLAREHDAAAKLCGSGGAVVVVPSPRTDTGRLLAAYEGAGFAAARPRRTAPAGA